MNDNRYYAHLKETFAAHVLTPVVVGHESGVEVWRLARPNSNTYSAQLIFTKAGIAIMGDVRFGDRDAAICHGYGKQWFCDAYEAAYMASKFGFFLPYSGRGHKYDCSATAIAMVVVIQETFVRLLAEQA